MGDWNFILNGPIMIKRLKQFYVSFFNWLVSGVAPADLDDVLIIRVDQLGDFILWLDSAKEYRKIYHGKKLTLLVNANWYDLAKSLPYWDDVVPLDTIKFRINPWYRFNFLLFIRKKGFEIVVCPRHFVKRTLEPAIVAISGATQKIVCEGSFPIEKENYFTRSIFMTHNCHELTRNADFIRALGRNHFKSTVPIIHIQNKLPRSLCREIVICPGSFRKRKEWPLYRFIKLMHLLYGESIIVCNDKPIKGLPSHVHNLTGMTELNEFIEIISNAKLVIANDSASIHLAAAFDVPSVCIGAESLGRFTPYDIEKPRDGMVLPRLIYKQNVKDITVDDVWEIVKRMI